jgi:exopolysaccharide biosynthesis polyprenyl glycosylphosphotransferase
MAPGCSAQKVPETVPRLNSSFARLGLGVPERDRLSRTRGEPAWPDTPFLLERTPPAVVSSRDKAIRRSLLVADVVAALLVGASAHVVFGSAGPGWTSAVLTLIVPFVNTASGLYRRDELLLSMNTLDEAPSVFQASTLSAVLAYLIESVALQTPLGAKLVALSIVNLTALTLLLRVAARTAARRGTPPERCLLLGGQEAERRLRDQLRSARAVKAEVVGRRALDQVSPPRGGSPLESLRTLEQAVRATRAERVVIAGDSAPPPQVHETIKASKALGVKVSLLPRLFDVVGSAVAFDYIGGMTLLGLRRFGLSRRARVVKRTFDLVGSAILLSLASPLLLLIAVAIRVTSPGPMVFRQTRIGRNGRPFQMLKFRSMVIDAEARKCELRGQNEAEGLFKIDGDPRVTAVGRLLRRTWLDELPQLVNVLRGEMSLVGPRPLVLDEDQLVQGWHRQRLGLTPGMTGPWQVLGAARIPLRDMVAIDYLYVANWSLWGDVKVCLRTVPCVLAGRGQ